MNSQQQVQGTARPAGVLQTIPNSVNGINVGLNNVHPNPT